MAKQSFGEYLKALRVEKDLTLNELANLTGYSDAYISQVEKGRRKNPPSLELLKRLSESLNVRYSVLLEKAGYEELAKGQKLLELQRQGMAEENQPSRISTPKENSKGGDKMYRGEKLKVKLIRGMTAGFDDTIDDNVNAWIASNEQAIVMDIKVVPDTRPYHVSALIIYKEPSEKGV